MFANRHGLAYIESGAEMAAGYLLVYTGDRVELHEAGAKAGRGFAVDFTTIDLRTGAGNLSRKQPLAKAIGKDTMTVVDATAGLGHDAVLLACMGYDVTAVERSPVIAALLEDGVRRAKEDVALAAAIGDRLHIVIADAKETLKSLEPRPDAVYVDPMFPPKRRKSALAKKHIRLVRAVVGDDADAANLVEVAKRCAKKRAVVKRPTHAGPLAGKPDLEFAGKLARYDVYLSR